MTSTYVEGKDGSWDFEHLSEDLIKVNRRKKVQGRHRGFDIQGPFWLMGTLVIKKGRMTFVRGGEAIEHRAGDRVGFCYPPFSIVEFINQDLELEGIAFLAAEKFRKGPKEAIRFPFDIERAMDLPFIEEFPSPKVVSRCDRPNVLALRLKDSLDKNFDSESKISDLAAQLGLSHAAATRAFKQCYGLTPVEYRSWLRVVAATFSHLLKGAKITEAAHLSGFEDLSRFNKQFNRITGTVPSKFAKTRKLQ
ncbi:MAG: helix-turn-helix domain-containing protein [Oligoflexales bacterium]